MEMEDHHPHSHQQQPQPQPQHEYGMSDLRQFITNRPSHHFPGIPQAAAAELFPGHHRNLTPQQGHHHHRHHHYEMLMMPRGLQDFTTPAPTTTTSAAANNVNNTTSNNTVTTASVSTPPSFSGFEGDVAASFGGDGGNGRWPRQETLTLLEIRSRLDSKFKEANQKGPLWDEVSRIMSEEHGYQRSGKKCREKFENLYKYYKKTKEGKAGRQDGKHYRFFRQLEALYGDTSNSVSFQETHLVGSSSLRFNHSTTQHQEPNFHSSSHQNKLCDNSLSLSNNSSEFNSSSSDDDDNDLSTMENDSTEKRRKKRGGRSWKAKIKEFIDSQMRKLMEKQEAWLEKLTKTLEQKEKERVLREEEWRRQEQDRIDKEHKFWAKERAWIESRDAALMEALQNLTGKQLKAPSSTEELMAAAVDADDDQLQNNSDTNNGETVSNKYSWTDSETTRLINLRTGMEARFQQSGCNSQEALWEEVASKMICLGYEKNALMCKDKWDCINNYMSKTKAGGNKKRKESYSRSSSGYLPSSESCLYSQGTAYETARLQLNDSSSPGAASNSNVGNNAVSDSCFRFLMADGDHLWENYGLRLSNGENQ